jgi:glucosamine kinase
MAFFLAMDSGGTKTDYVLADETTELARVRTGTIKRMRTDER